MHEALECLYRLKSLENLTLLKQERFLKICGLTDLSLHLRTCSQNQTKETLNGDKQTHFQLSQTLQFKDFCYGEIVFYSNKKFSKAQKSFLEKLSLSLASTLFFILQNQKTSLIEQQWGEIFNSFPQAFCITNDQFQIIRCNQAFQTLFDKKKEKGCSQTLFDLFPIPIKIPKTFKRKPFSFIAKAENYKVYWKIVCKKLYLKKETSQSFLFLIKDISAEMEFESKISVQSKNQEMGWMKGSLAHELNNPITGIKLLISIIENELSDSEKDIQEHLREMQKSIVACQNVIQNLLSASKTPTHKSKTSLKQTQ